MSIYTYPVNSNTPVIPGPGSDFATETTLLLIESAVDGLETLVGSTNTKLDSVIAGQKPEYTKVLPEVIWDLSAAGQNIVAANSYRIVTTTIGKVVRWQFANTSGSFIKVAYGPAASETNFAVIPPGGSAEVDVVIAAVISISITSDEAVSSGKFSLIGYA